MPALPAIGLVAGLVGSGVSAYSAVEQGQAQNRLAQYNAQLSEQQAALTTAQGAMEASAQRTQNAMILAKQRAAFAASGVVADTGSPLLVESKQAGYLEQAALQTQRNADIEAGVQTQQAGLEQAQGTISSEAGDIGAGATILQGASGAGSSYATGKYIGIM